jgi:hypothetical protein
VPRDFRNDSGADLPHPDFDAICRELYGWEENGRDGRPGEFFGASDELSPEEAQLAEESRKPR